MYNELNESTSLVSFHSRIVLHVIFELMSDFFPNYTFNNVSQRFVRNTFTFASAVSRDAMPKTNPMFLQGSKPLSMACAYSSELAKKFVGSARILECTPLSMVKMVTQHRYLCTAESGEG